MSDDLATATPLFWANSGAAKDRPTLVRLTPDSLTLAAVPGADLEHVIAELKDGGDVAGQVIPLSSLSGARGDEDGAELTVTFRTGPSSKESKAIAFVDKAQRDEFVAALVEALGPGWRQSPEAADPLDGRLLDPGADRRRGPDHLGAARGGGPDRSGEAARQLGKERQTEAPRHRRPLGRAAAGADRGADRGRGPGRRGPAALRPGHGGAADEHRGGTRRSILTGRRMRLATGRSHEHDEAPAPRDPLAPRPRAPDPLAAVPSTSSATTTTPGILWRWPAAC